MPEEAQLPDIETPETEETSQIRKFLESTNIAESLDDSAREAIGKDVVDGYTADLQSRKQWEMDLE